MFSFGRGIGRLERDLWYNKIPIIWIRPREWMKGMKVIGKRKDRWSSYRVAMERHPDLDFDKNASDAICLLDYGTSFLKPDIPTECPPCEPAVAR